MYIVSKCLLGENCKYNGGNNRNEGVIEFLKGKNYIAVCPEVTGGLPCPRPPAERQGDKIVNCEGKDVTFNFEEGARIEFAAAKEKSKELKEEIEGAVLKAKSPSCGKDYIYDGTFSGVLTEGDGCFVKILRDEEIYIISEKEITND